MMRRGADSLDYGHLKDVVIQVNIPISLQNNPLFVLSFLLNSSSLLGVVDNQRLICVVKNVGNLLVITNLNLDIILEVLVFLWL